MAKIPDGQKTDDENGGKGDPNMTGSGQTKAVQDLRAGGMTPSDDLARSPAFETLFPKKR